MDEEKLAWLEAYLEGKCGEKFQWGRADCSTLVAGWVDRASGTRWLDRIEGKYDSALSAAKFERQLLSESFAINCKFLPSAIENGLLEAGWRQHGHAPLSGDVLTARSGKFVGGSIFFSGMLCSMGEGLGFCTHNVAHVKGWDPEIRWWRMGDG